MPSSPARTASGSRARRALARRRGDPHRAQLRIADVTKLGGQGPEVENWTRFADRSRLTCGAPLYGTSATLTPKLSRELQAGQVRASVPAVMRAVELVSIAHVRDELQFQRLRRRRRVCDEHDGERGHVRHRLEVGFQRVDTRRRGSERGSRSRPALHPWPAWPPSGGCARDRRHRDRAASASRFSTTTDCPSAFASPSATVLLRMSVMPPAGYGETIVIARQARSVHGPWRRTAGREHGGECRQGAASCAARYRAGRGVRRGQCRGRCSWHVRRSMKTFSSTGYVPKSRVKA